MTENWSEAARTDSDWFLLDSIWKWTEIGLRQPDQIVINFYLNSIWKWKETGLSQPRLDSNWFWLNLISEWKEIRLSQPASQRACQPGNKTISKPPKPSAKQIYRKLRKPGKTQVFNNICNKNLTKTCVLPGFPGFFIKS